MGRSDLLDVVSIDNNPIKFYHLTLLYGFLEGLSLTVI
nr:MAG TPA: hypothetical protein [Caudoviricetes sp.]DAW46941.1 MAG TPA: hypothetical protein [Caudoviricetes sp.]